jgi:hypothetical protein
MDLMDSMDGMDSEGEALHLMRLMRWLVSSSPLLILASSQPSGSGR